MRSAIPAGDVLRVRLDEMSLTPVEFAEQTGLSTKHVHRILTGHAYFSPAEAITFERVTGVSASLWLGLQTEHQLWLARRN